MLATSSFGILDDEFGLTSMTVSWNSSTGGDRHVLPPASKEGETLAVEFGLKLTIFDKIFGSVSSFGKWLMSSSCTRPQKRTLSPQEST